MHFSEAAIVGIWNVDDERVVVLDLALEDGVNASTINQLMRIFFLGKDREVDNGVTRGRGSIEVSFSVPTARTLFGSEP